MYAPAPVKKVMHERGHSGSSRQDIMPKIVVSYASSFITNGPASARRHEEYSKDRPTGNPPTSTRLPSKYLLALIVDKTSTTPLPSAT